MSAKANVTFITISSDEESPDTRGLLEKLVVAVTDYVRAGGCVEVHRSTSGAERIKELEAANASQAKRIFELEALLAGERDVPITSLYTVTATDILLPRDENGLRLSPNIERGARLPIYREGYIPNRPTDELRGFIVPLGQVPQKNIALKFTTGRPHPPGEVPPLP